MQNPSESYGQGPVIGSQGGHRGGGHAQQPAVELTPEERKIFQECNSDSFFQRSLPAAILAGGLAIISIKRGIISPSLRFGMAPKVTVAAFLGYMFGKVSYLDACRDKFLAKLPNSNMSIAIRKARGLEVVYDQQSGYQDEAPDKDEATDVFKGESSDGESVEQKKRFSYDDLRDQRRRAVPNMQQQQPPQAGPSYSRMAPSSAPPPSLMPADDYTQTTTGQKPKGTNKYGDEGFE